MGFARRLRAPALKSGNLARVGPTTPTRARRLADASVDPTDARKGTGSGVSRRRTTATPPHATGMRAVVPVLLFSDNCH